MLPDVGNDNTWRRLDDDDANGTNVEFGEAFAAAPLGCFESRIDRTGSATALQKSARFVRFSGDLDSALPVLDPHEYSLKQLLTYKRSIRKDLHLESLKIQSGSPVCSFIADRLK